jgi:hypothetical protein
MRPVGSPTKMVSPATAPSAAVPAKVNLVLRSARAAARHEAQWN